MLLTEASSDPENMRLDVIVAKAVFQYLCLSNLKDANILFSTVRQLDEEVMLTIISLLLFLFLQSHHYLYIFTWCF